MQAGSGSGCTCALKAARSSLPLSARGYRLLVRKAFASCGACPSADGSGEKGLALHLRFGKITGLSGRNRNANYAKDRPLQRGCANALEEEIMATAAAVVEKNIKVGPTKLLINGEWGDSASRQTVPTRNPATGAVVSPEHGA